MTNDESLHMGLLQLNFLGEIKVRLCQNRIEPCGILFGNSIEPDSPCYRFCIAE